MNLNEQHDMVKLTRRIESLEAKVYGGADNKKVAVYAPEPWQKEKVAKVWGVENTIEIYHDAYQHCEYVIWVPNKISTVYSESHFFNQVRTEFKMLSFQDFCKQHGISDKPDYVWFDGKILPAQILEYRLCVQIPGTFKYASVENNRAATEKEYLEQEWKELEGFEMDEPPKKEPKFKLNEEWYEWKGIDYEKSKPFVEGANAMQKAIYDRALEIFNEVDVKYPALKQRNWEYSCKEAIKEIKQGKIKPPQS